MSNTTTFGQMIHNISLRQGTQPAVRIKVRGKWKNFSWTEYYSNVLATAAAFTELGIKKGDKVAIMSNTRWEWAICDLALIGLKAVVVPIYQNCTAEDMEYILTHSEAKMLICENKFSLSAWRKISENCPQVESVICFEIDRPEDSKVQMWPKILKMGRENSQKHKEHFEKSCLSQSLDDTATLVYTSGTTGRPKGVVITQEQVVSEITESLTFCGMNSRDTVLTFLPFAHVLGRVEHWGHVHLGFTMAYAENIEKIRFNLPEVQPTVLVAVPRIFEKVYSHILSQVETHPLKSKLFQWALKVGQKVSYFKMTNQIIPLATLLEYEAAKTLVLNKIRDAFGGRLRFAISGGAPISQDLAQFFYAAGILILEGYGLTETTAAITANSTQNFRFGSVGRPIGEVQIKIAEDGEILVKSKKVMKEYFKDPESTESTLVNGWLQTGDIGELLPGGHLKITDRKKDLIKTAGGKYVAPQKLENLLKINPLISNVLIHGDQRKYVVALVALDRVYLEQWAKREQWPYEKWTDLIQQPQVQESVRETVTEANRHLASFESIKKFKILPQEFTIEGGELTPSLKVKRKVLDVRFKEAIEELFT